MGLAAVPFGTAQAKDYTIKVKRVYREGIIHFGIFRYQRMTESRVW